MLLLLMTLMALGGQPPPTLPPACSPKCQADQAIIVFRTQVQRMGD